MVLDEHIDRTGCSSKCWGLVERGWEDDKSLLGPLDRRSIRATTRGTPDKISSSKNSCGGMDRPEI